MDISKHLCKTGPIELPIFLKFRESYEKLLHPVTILKMLCSRGIFLPYLRTISKNFDPFQSYSSPFQQVTSHYVPLKFMRVFNRYTRWTLLIFNPTACGNAADTAIGCQLISYSHVEKDLNRNEHLNFSLE